MATIAPWLQPQDFLGAIRAGAGLGLQVRERNDAEVQAAETLRQAQESLFQRQQQMAQAAQQAQVENQLKQQAMAQSQAQQEQENMMRAQQLAQSQQEQQSLMALRQNEEARKQNLFNQQAQFAQLAKSQVLPGGGDFEGGDAEEQKALIDKQRQKNLDELIRNAPQDVLPSLIGKEESNLELEQRAKLQRESVDARAQMRQDALDRRLAILEEGRNARSEARRNANAATVTITLPDGSRVTRKVDAEEAASLAEQEPSLEPGSAEEAYAVALKASKDGLGLGKVVNGEWVPGTNKFGFGGNSTPTDALKKISPSVDKKTRATIRKMVDSQPEPQALGLPTDTATKSATPKEKAELANKIAAENPTWTRSQVLAELAKRLQ